MTGTPGRTVVTGAAGRVAAAVREGLRDAGHLVLLDRLPPPPGYRARGNETWVRADIADPRALAEAFAGADAVVHLAGIPDEAPLPDLLRANVEGTHNVLEAARRAGVPRVVLASSNRATGNYPVDRTVTAADPPRPDGFYGVSKAAAEALGRLYADAFGLQVAAVRIGSLEERPTEARHLATWLSPRDCAGFFRAAVTAPGVTFVAAYAVSANARRFWDLSAGEAGLGYRPVDDAEAFAAEIPGGDPFWDGGPQGGAYAGPGALLPHLPDPGR
ncbi:NAD-dependent epimerase/dehydratase family protein [Nocardiopsis potens]|uniref:NAD-dependent epimerase/dehydratase family protein n=1 Tax=Nocardiopsis potens TaxID=1246458 RepID=UPI000344BE8B|nr:NAD(P)-dependent oxidoreductase [Nocardiopsis potens]